MDNMVGDNLPSEKKVAQLIIDLTKVIDDFEKFCVVLQPEQRASTLKPPASGEAMAQSAADLAGRHKVSVNNVPLQGMLNDLAFVKAVRPLAALMARGQKLVADSLLQGNSEYWEAFLAYYGALGNAANHDAGLATELKSLQDQMRDLRKPRGRAAATTPTGAPPTAPTGNAGSGAPTTPTGATGPGTGTPGA
jgi:hypothetical protein